MRTQILTATLVALATFTGCTTSTNPASTAETKPGEPVRAATPGAAPPAAPRAVAQPIVIPAGQAISVRTTTTLSTKTAEAGTPFVAHLTTPLTVGTQVIAPAGSEVRGVIANSDDGGRVKGLATLSIRLTGVTTANGQLLPISTSVYGVQARATKGKDATKIGIGAGVGAAIGAIAGGGKGAAIGAATGGGAGTGVVLATRGDPAVIPAESIVNFSLTAPVTVR